MKTIDIYTDGACSGNPGPGGLGAVLLYNGTAKEISKAYRKTTNNRMELSAAIVALEAVKEPVKVTIYSDSKYLVDAVEKGWLANWKRNGWKKKDRQQVLNIDLWRRIDALLRTHNVEFVWVKGHDSNPMNNRCDELATGAISCGPREIDYEYENLYGN